MPIATDFDFNRDISPYVSNYLGEISRDTRLRPETARRLMSDVITGTNDVEMQRLKLQAEQQNSVLRQMRIEQGQLALQDARRRTRMFEEIDSASRSSAQEIQSVMRGSGTPEQKRQEIGAIGVNYMGTPAYRAVEDQVSTAFRSLPVEKTKGDLDLSTDLIQEAVETDIPEDILRRGNKAEIAAAIGEATRRRYEEEKRQKEIISNRKELKSLLSAPVRFEDDTRDPGIKWLEPESHNNLKILVNTLGTDDEKKAFYESQDDVRRANIAGEIRVREMSRLLDERDTEQEDISAWARLAEKRR